MEENTTDQPAPPGEAPFCPTRAVIGEGLSHVAQRVAILAGQKGMSGASYEYIVVRAEDVQAVFEGGQGGMLYDFLADIRFHDGPVGPEPMNGVCETSLLAIVADRLAAFQGPGGCNWENDEAFKCVIQAINWINRGTLQRAREAQHNAAVEAARAAQQEAMAPE
jgi:hypothetical protein